jgi:hypothetical protein
MLPVAVNVPCTGAAGLWNPHKEYGNEIRLKKPMNT